MAKKAKAQVRRPPPKKRSDQTILGSLPLYGYAGNKPMKEPPKRRRS